MSAPPPPLQPPRYSFSYEAVPTTPSPSSTSSQMSHMQQQHPPSMTISRSSASSQQPPNNHQQQDEALPRYSISGPASRSSLSSLSRGRNSYSRPSSFDMANNNSHYRKSSTAAYSNTYVAMDPNYDGSYLSDDESATTPTTMLLNNHHSQGRKHHHVSHFNNDHYTGDKEPVRIMLIPVLTKETVESRRSFLRRRIIYILASLSILSMFLIHIPWGLIESAISKNTSDSSISLPPNTTPVTIDLATSSSSTCQQQSPLVPTRNDNLNEIYKSQYDLNNASFADRIAGLLSGMVKIKTASFDDMKTKPPALPAPDDDVRRAGLDVLHEYLKANWPLV
ncbi:hypothetical protein HDU76_008441 [Blyttiomyces sp. JEL0837]|nr:hypothetical protein HDU76_008441 [Blyttiomyces sp. JEL0837]